MFKKILIANRAEIACRVIRTARRMGIGAVAVYSDADADALHVEMADEAVHIGGAAAAQSYLLGDAIIDACRQSGAEAVHPGYGFLSENAEFARRLEDAGIAFIGPGAAAIEAMGDKIASKALAKKAGVSTIPGHDGVVADAEQAARIAAQIGFPVMIKASAGGGGKGMRIVRNADEVAGGFARASGEALSSFGDARILMEKFIEQPRHIEIQLIADSHGNIITLNERECSIQRRHQKVIEEAPSPFIDAKTRASMSQQAATLAKAVEYRSAGTVEFVVDAARNFYFLEMNTRLQVEHPVTEMITGLDLVELMIRVAAGEKLPLKQSEVELNGWAIESRIYAENPYRNFLPSIGRLVRYAPPRASQQVRVDAGVVEGAEISRFYDPMIAKLVTWGRDRKRAIARMQTALDEYYIRGIDTNQPFVAAIMAHPRFQRGALTTEFIAEEYPHGFARGAQRADESTLAVMIVVIASLHHRLIHRAATISGQLRGYGRTIGDQWVVEIEQQYYPVRVLRDATVHDDDAVRPDARATMHVDESFDSNGWTVEYEGQRRRVCDAWRATQTLYRGAVDDVQVTMQFERRGHDYDACYRGVQLTAKVLSPRAAELHALMPRKTADSRAQLLLSPMPGLLAALHVKPGDAVKAGQELAVIEAMKMENALCAEHDGVIDKALAQPGDTLDADQPILEFAAPSA